MIVEKRKNSSIFEYDDSEIGNAGCSSTMKVRNHNKYDFFFIENLEYCI